MIWYKYTVSRNGKEERGQIEAAGLLGAAEKLKQDGGYILELKERFSWRLIWASGWLESLINPWSERALKSEKLLFTSQLGEMLKTGVPIIKAIEVFVDEKGGQAAQPLKKIMSQLEMGRSLSQALAGYPRIFDKVYISVVRSGEAMGKLAETLIYLGRQLKREHDLRNKVKAALIYPTVVLTAMVVVMSFISFSVVPKIVTFAQNSGAQLPPITLIMIAVTTFIQKYWPGLLLILGITIILTWRGMQTDQGRILVDRLVLRLPLVGNLMRRYHQVRFARLLSGFHR